MNKPKRRKRGNEKSPCAAYPAGWIKPKRWPTPQDFYAAIQEYFDACDAHNEQVQTKDGDVIEINKPLPKTMTGIHRHLNISKEGFRKYKLQEGYGEVVEWARRICEDDLLTGALTGRYYSKTAHFALMRHHGWREPSRGTSVNFNTTNNKVVILAPPEHDAAKEFGIVEDGAGDRMIEVDFTKALNAPAPNGHSNGHSNGTERKRIKPAGKEDKGDGGA